MSTSPQVWDNRFMTIAVDVSHWSKDPDEGVGAVVVSADRRQLSVGYNGFPRGNSHDGMVLGKEQKNRLTIHAERNALDNAPFPLQGATIYVTKAPCFECMKGIIQKGVARVVSPRPVPTSRWCGDQLDAVGLAAEHGVMCEEVSR